MRLACRAGMAAATSVTPMPTSSAEISPPRGTCISCTSCATTTSITRISPCDRASPTPTPSAEPTIPDDRGFGQDLAHDLSPGHAQRAQHPDLAGALDDGHREGVVDEKPADEQRDGAEHIQPHLVAGQHLRHALALRRGISHKVSGAEPGLQPRLQICQRGAGRRLGSRDDVHLVDVARAQEKVLGGLQRDHAEGAVVQLARPVFVHQADDLQAGLCPPGVTSATSLPRRIFFSSAKFLTSTIS